MARPADPNVRSKLLAAAEQAFGAVGVERAHVEAIATLAGVSKGAFYNHFASKDEAFRELVAALIGRLRELVSRPDPVTPTPTPEEFFEHCLEFDMRIFEFIWENRRFMRVVLEGGRSHAWVHLVDEFADHSRKLVVEHLAFGQSHGLFRRDLDIELSATFLSGGYDRLARSLVRMNERPDLYALLSSIQTTILYGIARPSASLGEAS